MQKASRFDYVAYDKEAQEKQMKVKEAAQALELAIEEVMPFEKCTIAAKTKALNSLETCYMWLGKGIRDGQINRNGKAEIQK